jgi:hypothetical protein
MPLIDNKITTYTYFKYTFCSNYQLTIDQQNTMNLKNVKPSRSQNLCLMSYVIYDFVINNDLKTQCDKMTNNNK